MCDNRVCRDIVSVCVAGGKGLEGVLGRGEFF